MVHVLSIQMKSIKRRLHNNYSSKTKWPKSYLKMIVNDLNPSPEKFYDLTEDERKEVLYEEAFVIAMERLPF